MTGTHCPRNTVVNLNMKRFRHADHKFLAQSFKKAGYKCGYVGKWHLECVP